ALEAWRVVANNSERRFSVMVSDRLIEGSTEEQQAVARESASLLLSLPWELLDDGRGFLFQGNHSVRVRRRLPNRHSQEVRPSSLPLRILLVSPRPEDARTGYIDHRISAKPLVEAVAELGALATVTLLAPPTFSALQQELTRAAKASQPYDVVHFDGHGIYNARVGLGQLCFEDPNDAHLLDGRAMQPIDAAKLAAEMRAYRIPLVFLEACQSAKSDEDPTASVAAKMLEEGVTSVVAMTHSVLVETARRFVAAFYTELARGARVGTAMLAGQHALFGDTYRGQVAGAGDLNLQDWFVPVLFQEANDPRLLTQLPSERARQLQTERRRLSLGRLPAEPPHTFIGRSRELLRLERLLLPDAPPELRYAVVRGVGGEGKTTLTAELARWMVGTNRFARAAFVSFDPNNERGCGDARSLLDSLGQQLLPEGERWSVAEHEWKEAVQQVERALRDHPTILVLDNLESVLPPTKPHEETRRGSESQVVSTSSDEGEAKENLREPSCDLVGEIFALCQTLLRAHTATRIVFTSRESLPAPFDHPQREITLGQLSSEDAVELVSQVLRSQHRRLPEAEQLGGTAQAITDLVETANRHARALVLLARELADRDLRSTTDDLRQALAALDRRHPGDRENSLYASVALSLRRLTPEAREMARALAVFHGGAHPFVLGMMLEAEQETIFGLAAQLVAVGLAEAMPYNHLRLDPALPSFLLRELSEAEQEAARSRWAAAMRELTVFLYQQRGKDAALAARLTLLELPNLMAMLRWFAERAAAEEVVDLARAVEELLANLGRPQALAQATRVREQAARSFSAGGEWSYARFLAASAHIDRLLEGGDLPAAYAAAQQLLQRSLAAGEGAFPAAAYDIAMAHWQLGRVLKMGGEAAAALPLLAEARRRFEALAAAGDTDAERMASVAITEGADCLTALGRWDEAAAAYQEAIKLDEKRDAQRDVATNKFQLGTVRLLQQRYDEALAIYREARDIFAGLGEPRTVATTWHQIGIVHKKAGQFEQAEHAYRQSLAIKVQQKNQAGEASSLGELGNLYLEMGRLEEAVKCYRQAADIDVRLQNQGKEGLRRNNLALTLIRLERYPEARRELHRAIECGKPYGHAAELWKTWNNLCDLEQATGHPQAAAAAREQALALYLAYRRDGGQSMDWGAQRCAAIAQAIAQGQADKLDQELAEYLRTSDDPRAKALLPKLQAILGGDRDPAPAADPALTYVDAAELQLLLEGLRVE
ncbi:MAG: tetratricopeptide repeat protein, partial [Acidobacteriota bacterium]|nr:tetratricopeptide repeat protein [Acidobacteriota bacterium]